jgi:hypothetical protein
VSEDALHDGRVLDRDDEAEPPAAGARENVDLEDAAQQRGPRERATHLALRRRAGRGIRGACAGRLVCPVGGEGAGHGIRATARPCTEDAVVDEQVDLRFRINTASFSKNSD